MRGLDSFKTGRKETGANRNVVPLENAKNLIDCKETNKTLIQEGNTPKSLINLIRKCQATFFWQCDEMTVFLFSTNNAEQCQN